MRISFINLSRRNKRKNIIHCGKPKEEILRSYTRYAVENLPLMEESFMASQKQSTESKKAQD